MSNIVHLELNEITKFRLDEINKIKDFFNNEINERKQQINKINKYVAAFNYADKVFIVLSASFGSLSIASHETVVGIPVGIAALKLNGIGIELLSSSLINFDICHEEFTKIINEKVNYERFKQDEMKIGQETEV